MTDGLQGRSTASTTSRQYTGQDGFSDNNLTGKLTFRPVLSAGEQLEIWATNTIQWESLVAEEQRGGRGRMSQDLQI